MKVIQAQRGGHEGLTQPLETHPRVACGGPGHTLPGAERKAETWRVQTRPGVDHRDVTWHAAGGWRRFSLGAAPALAEPGRSGPQSSPLFRRPMAPSCCTPSASPGPLAPPLGPLLSAGTAPPAGGFRPGLQRRSAEGLLRNPAALGVTVMDTICCLGAF